MTSKEWLTIEDWLESAQALCPLAIRHEGRLERAENNLLHVCFTSSRIGGHVLGGGSSQVSGIRFVLVMCLVRSIWCPFINHCSAKID